MVRKNGGVDESAVALAREVGAAQSVDLPLVFSSDPDKASTLRALRAARSTVAGRYPIN